MDAVITELLVHKKKIVDSQVEDKIVRYWPLMISQWQTDRWPRIKCWNIP